MSDEFFQAQQAYRDDHNAAVEPHYRVAEAYERARLAYAVTGIRAAYTMNAGAAVALPTFSEVLNLQTGTAMSYAVGLFVLGLILTFVANFLAFYSAENSSAASIEMSIISAVNVAKSHNRPLSQENATDQISAHDRLEKRSGRQANVAAILIGAAILCFAIGVAVASNVAEKLCVLLN